MIDHHWFIDISCDSFGVCLSKTTSLPTIIEVGRVIDFDSTGEDDFIVSKAEFDIDGNCCLPTLEYCGKTRFTSEGLRCFVNERILKGWKLDGGTYDGEPKNFPAWCQQHGLNYVANVED